MPLWPSPQEFGRRRGHLATYTPDVSGKAEEASTNPLFSVIAYLGPDFVSEGRSLILYGKTGRGKTHLAIAIGYRAIQNGFETFCTTAAELIEDLSNAGRKGQLQQSLLTYTRPHVLVIDEVGYLTYGQDAANVLFHVVNHRHLKKRPMIFTTNKPLSEWGKVLHDEDLAAAILDRVLERGRFVHLDGPSGRTRHLKLEEALPATPERARISGNCVPEFSEPTTEKCGAAQTRLRYPSKGPDR
jgi:DNA replication protein DnaC